MRLSKIRVQHVRNHTEFTCDFGAHMTLIHGKNGTGKTSVLEAIYMAYRGTSFKGSDNDIVTDTKRWFRVDALDESDISRRVIFDRRQERPIKEFTIDDKKFHRLPVRYKRPIVLFTPNDLRLIDGSPARRRDYLDAIISQLNPAYGPALRRYERTLLQRNKLLKNPYVTADQFFAWNIILSEAGSVIINERHAYIEHIQQRIMAHYRSIATSNDDISVEYTHTKTTPAKLLAQYEQSFERDRELGNTTIGPHRHDLVINLKHSLASDVASRGETRTIVVALKYIEAELLLETFGEYPLVLLDDVYGELDLERRRNLSHTLNDYQIIITSTDKITGLPRSTKRIEL